MAMATYLLVHFPSICQDDVVGGIHLLPSSLPGVVPFILYMRVITLVTHEVASSIAQRRHHTSSMSNPVFEITIESGATPVNQGIRVNIIRWGYSIHPGYNS